LLSNKFIYYNGDRREIVRAFEMTGCCEPFHIVFLIRMPEKFVRIFVEFGKEQDLINGLDNPDFKIENLASTISQSATPY